MHILPNSRRHRTKFRVVFRHIVVAGLALGCATTAAFTQGCMQDRTLLEMAGHTLCLPLKAMPSISRNESGAAYLLIWDKPERLPATAQLPPGTFHLSFEVSQFNPPPLEETVPSELPEMRQTTEGLATHLFPSLQRFHPTTARLNGQPFTLECRTSINPEQAKQGAQDCEIYAMAAAGIRVHVFLETVVWARGPAWPPLDEKWVETWPPYLTDLGAGINNLLSIQQ